MSEAADSLSLDDLKNDLDRITDDLRTRVFIVPDDIKSYLQQQLLPFVSNVVEVMEGIDGDVSDLVEHAEDILQPETAGIFALAIQQGLGFAEEPRQAPTSRQRRRQEVGTAHQADAHAVRDRQADAARDHRDA